MAPTFVLRHAALVTRDLARVLPFYRDTLGLVARTPDARTLTLHFHEAAPAILTFTEDRAAVAPTGRVAGLFHVALLVPDRPALAAVLARLVEQRAPVAGLSDHGVSEAIYLSDPDGNGLELYRDRPRAEWPPSRAGEVAMFTRALDHRDLLRELPSPPPAAPLATAAFGHLHLSVADLAAVEKFLVGELGQTVTQRGYPGALFLAADGYHHHFGANTWDAPAPRGAQKYAGLAGFTVATTRVSAPLALTDPSGLAVTLEPLSA